MKVKLDPGAYMPTRAHGDDAGYDLRARETKIIPPRGSVVFDTGVHVQLPRKTAGFLVSKSGLYTNYEITSTGLVDEGYTGPIRVKLLNHGDEPYRVGFGDKISQLVIVKIKRPKPKHRSKLKNSERGDNGFGSTGK